MEMHFPLEINDVEPELAKELAGLFIGQAPDYVRVGPKGYLFPKKIEINGPKIYNLAIRPDDIVVSSTPRSGTTWLQELVWLIANDLDYAKATEINLVNRYKFLEHSIFFDPVTLKNMVETKKGDESTVNMIMQSVSADTIESVPSPRFLKTHLPFTLLPPSTVDTAKVLFITRDPRDVAVSFYHHNRLILIHGYVGDFKTYWNYFIKDLIYYTPYFECVKEAWNLRHHPNMLFLFYEDLIKDLPAAVGRVSSFLGKSLGAADVARLCDHLSFHNFKSNKSVNIDRLYDAGLADPKAEPFIRKGKTGGWREYFDDEMLRQAEQWMADNLRDTDLRFPHLENQ